MTLAKQCKEGFRIKVVDPRYSRFNGHSGRVTMQIADTAYQNGVTQILRDDAGSPYSEYIPNDAKVNILAYNSSTVANALAAHRAKNEGETEVKVENALTLKQYKDIYDSLCDANTDSDTCASACRTVGFVLGDIHREIGDMCRKFDKEAADDGRAIEASLMACDRAHGTLATAVAALRRNVAKMANKYAGYDAKRLID